MRQTQCKDRPAARQRAAPGRVCLALAATLLASCRPAARSGVSAEALENSLPAPHVELGRAAVADLGALRPMMVRLGDRMGLIVVRSPRQWAALVAAAPALRAHAPPQFGCVVCLLSWTGTPLSGRFPSAIRAVHVADGAAIVIADFEAGTYLPDGAAYIDAVLAPGVRDVLAVDVGGTRFSLTPD